MSEQTFEEVVKHLTDVRVLVAKEADLETREDKLKGALTALSKKEDVLSRREKSADDKEKTLNNRAISLDHREMELSELQDRVNKLISLHKIKI